MSWNSLGFFGARVDGYAPLKKGTFLEAGIMRMNDVQWLLAVALCCSPEEYEAFYFRHTWFSTFSQPHIFCSFVLDKFGGWEALEMYPVQISSPFVSIWIPARLLCRAVRGYKAQVFRCSRDRARQGRSSGQLVTVASTDCGKDFYNIAKIWRKRWIMWKGSPGPRGCDRRTMKFQRQKRKHTARLAALMTVMKRHAPVAAGSSSNAGRALPLTGLMEEYFLDTAVHGRIRSQWKGKDGISQLPGFQIQLEQYESYTTWTFGNLMNCMRWKPEVDSSETWTFPL